MRQSLFSLFLVATLSVASPILKTTPQNPTDTQANINPRNSHIKRQTSVQTSKSPDSFYDSASSNLSNLPAWLFPFSGKNPYAPPKSTSDPFADDNYVPTAPTPVKTDPTCKVTDGDTTKCQPIGWYWWAPRPANTIPGVAVGPVVASQAQPAVQQGGSTGLLPVQVVPEGYEITNPVGPNGWQSTR